MSEAQPGWKRCSACKEPIAFGAQYWVCNVSTCNRVRTALQFCSVDCWEVHLPSANHRESWAVEKHAPSEAQAKAEASATPAKSGKRRLVRPASSAPNPQPGNAPPQEVLIVASRLKDYIRARVGFNTSDGVLEPLSEIVREVCERAIQNARSDGRKTVLDRDIPKS